MTEIHTLSTLDGKLQIQFEKNKLYDNILDEDGYEVKQKMPSLRYSIRKHYEFLNGYFKQWEVIYMAFKLGEKKLKFAVFGTGWWSNFQIPAWLGIGNVELVALYNRTASKARKTAEKYGVSRVFDDPEELLKNVDLDFVDIFTEAPAHTDIVSLCL